jgi:hypothetical protein
LGHAQFCAENAYRHGNWLSFLLADLEIGFLNTNCISIGDDGRISESKAVFAAVDPPGQNKLCCYCLVILFSCTHFFTSTATSAFLKEGITSGIKAML